MREAAPKFRDSALSVLPSFDRGSSIKVTRVNDSVVIRALGPSSAEGEQDVGGSPSTRWRAADRRARQRWGEPATMERASSSSPVRELLHLQSELSGGSMLQWQSEWQSACACGAHGGDANGGTRSRMSPQSLPPPPNSPPSEQRSPLSPTRSLPHLPASPHAVAALKAAASSLNSPSKEYDEWALQRGYTPLFPQPSCRGDSTGGRGGSGGGGAMGGGGNASSRPTTSGFRRLWLPRIQTPPESTFPSESPKCSTVSPTHTPACSPASNNGLAALSPALSTPTPTQQAATEYQQPSPKPLSGSEFGAAGVTAGRMDGQIATDARAGPMAGQPMAHGRRRSQRRKQPSSRAHRAAHATSMPWVAVEPSASPMSRAPGQREQSKLHQIAHARQLRRVWQHTASSMVQSIIWVQACVRRWLTAARLRLAARRMAEEQRAMRAQGRAAGTVVADTHSTGGQGVMLTEVPAGRVADEANSGSKSGVAEAYAAEEGGGMHRRWKAACSSWESDMASCALARRRAAKSRAAAQQMSLRPDGAASSPAAPALAPAGRHGHPPWYPPPSSHASSVTAAVASPSCSKLPSWNRTWTPHHPTAQAAVHASVHAGSGPSTLGSEPLPPPTSSAAEGASSPSRTILRVASVPAGLLLLRAAEEQHHIGAHADSRVGRETRMEARLSRLEGALLTQSHARVHPLNSVRGGPVRQRVRAT